MDAAVDAVAEFFSTYHNRDIDQMVALCVPNGAFEYVPMGPQGAGRIDQTGRQVWASLIDTFPDLTIEVKSILGDSVGNAAAEVIISGTQAKDFAGIPSTGRRFTLPHGFFFHVRESGIDRIAAYWDNATLEEQLTA